MSRSESAYIAQRRRLTLSLTHRHIAGNWTRTAHSPSHAPSTPVSKLAAPRFSHLGPVRFIDGIEHLVLLDLLGVPSPRIPSYFRSTAWMHSLLADMQHRLTQAGVFWPSGTSNRQEEKWLTKGMGGGGIEDDHLPFLHNGVPVLHLIPVPFPLVWHTMKVSRCSAAATVFSHSAFDAL